MKLASISMFSIAAALSLGVACNRTPQGGDSKGEEAAQVQQKGSAGTDTARSGDTLAAKPNAAAPTGAAAPEPAADEADPSDEELGLPPDDELEDDEELE